MRWLEERLVPESERPNIQPGLIWHNKFHVHMDSSDSEDEHKHEDEWIKYNYVMDRGQLK